MGPPHWVTRKVKGNLDCDLLVNYYLFMYTVYITHKVIPRTVLCQRMCLITSSIYFFSTPVPHPFGVPVISRGPNVVSPRRWSGSGVSRSPFPPMAVDLPYLFRRTSGNWYLSGFFCVGCRRRGGSLEIGHGEYPVRVLSWSVGLSPPGITSRRPPSLVPLFPPPPTSRLPLPVC